MTAVADAFLTSDLTLDIRSALQQVDRLNDAVHRATTDVRVTVDARQVATAIDAALSTADTTLEVTADGARLTSSVAGAIDQADATVEVDADTRRVTGQVDAALDAADTLVEVAADAGRVTGAINAAVDNADTTVQVTGTISPALVAAADDLDDGLASAAVSGGLLAGALGALSVGAVGAGLFALADAASELEQSIGGTEAVFGEAADTVSDFATTAASMAGLTETAARTLTSQIGGLLKGFGFTKQEAADTSVVLAQLGADLAATFGGAPAEAVEALGGALRGEFNPLERFGVSLNVAQIEAYALANGMAESAKEVTISVRAQAALALIMERTSDAQGQFNRELATAGGAMSVARAEFGNMAASAGQLLLPALIELVQTLTSQVGPGLMDAAERVLPAVSDALINLAPLLGTATDLLVAMAPIVQVVAEAIALIPAPMLQAAGALLTFNKMLALVTASAQVGAISKVGSALAGLAVPAGSVAGAFAGAPLAAGKFTTSLRGLTTGAAGAGLALTGAFIAVQMYGDMMADARAEGEAFGASLRGSFDPATASMDELVAASADLDGKIAELQGSVDDSFLGRNTINKDYNEAIKTGIAEAEAFKLEIDAMAQAMREADAEAEFGATIAGLTNLNDAMDRLGEESPRVLRGIQSIGADASAQDFLDLALNIGEAALSEEAMADAAAALGTDVESLTGYVDAATEALDNFVASAAGGLPSLGDVFSETLQEASEWAAGLADNVRNAAESQAQGIRDAAAEQVAAAGESISEERRQQITESAEAEAQAILDGAGVEADAIAESGKITAGALTANLLETAAQLRTFRTNLRTIAEAGFSDIAGMIAEQGIETGEAVAAELAAAVNNDDFGLLEALQSANETFERESNATLNYLRNTLGPEYVLTAGLIGTSITDAFGSNLDLGERLRIANDVAELQMDEGGKAVAALAAGAGSAAAREYGAALNLDEKTINEAVLAGEAIKANAPVGAARTAGEDTAEGYVSGFVNGMSASQVRASLAAQGLTGQALISAMKLLGIHSPSTKMMWVGEMMGEGLALGITASIPTATAAVRAEVAAMAATAASAGPLALPRATVTGGAGLGAQGAAGVDGASMRELVRILADAMPRQLAGDIYVSGRDTPTEAIIARELQSLAVRL